ncbi:hypothetical protein Glove_199g42 [Diversispora epigaea]|uniref:Protein kinase domain-containing protein n=1 Tax=Diversispora epigaea TaxID=1348612 RepID=A0A397IQ00_9GLOM|nr:hypothetical protein Glove_199g42 [Diversispora epigaea]
MGGLNSPYKYLTPLLKISSFPFKFDNNFQTFDNIEILDYEFLNLLKCNQEYNGYWCKPCDSKHFQNDFNNWTSGNEKIDKFIQDSQLNANSHQGIIEWIPYAQFKGVKQIGRGGFGTIHYARWIDGFIEDWDIKNRHWERYANMTTTTTTTHLNYQTYPQAIYTSRLLNYSKLPKPKNEENFESKLEKLTKSTSVLIVGKRFWNS